MPSPSDTIGPSPIWDAIAHVSRALESDTPPRAILLITDGCATANLITDGEAADHAVRAGVAVHAMLFSSPMSIPQQDDKVAVPQPGIAVARVAQSTGGIVYRLQTLSERSDATAWAYFERAFAVASMPYTLAFHPTIADGRPHRLVVKVTRPGAVAYAAPVFLAPRIP